MGKIFDELSYRHYKNKNWAGMVSSLLKIRMKGSISKELIKALNDDSNIAKQILKVDRFFLIKSLSNSKPRIPITIDNIIYFYVQKASARSDYEKLLELLTKAHKELRM